MFINTSSLEQNLNSLSKIITCALKLGILIGGVCVIVYSLKIGHFPQDISAGDGLLFLMAAACFGVVYVFFVASLVALGISVSPVVRVVFKFSVRGVNLFYRQKKQPVHEFAPFEWTAILFALFSIFIIIVLGSRDTAAYWNLPLLSIGLYFFYSLYLSFGKNIKQIEIVNNSLVHTTEKENIAQLGNLESLRKRQQFILAIILFIPLAIGGVSGELLDATMRMTHVRIEKSIIYIKEPYSSLIPKLIAATDHSAPKEYTPFDKIVVLFKGFGKITVISFQDGNTIRKLEIPNDQLIIETP